MAPRRCRLLFGPFSQRNKAHDALDTAQPGRELAELRFNGTLIHLSTLPVSLSRTLNCAANANPDPHGLPDRAVLLRTPSRTPGNAVQ